MINYFCKDSNTGGVWVLGVSNGTKLYSQISDMARLSYNLLRSQNKTDSYHSHAVSSPSESIWYYEKQGYINGIKQALAESNSNRCEVYRDSILNMTSEDAKELFMNTPEIFLDTASIEIYKRLSHTTFKKCIYGKYALRNGFCFSDTSLMGISFENVYQGNHTQLSEIVAIEDTRISFYAKNSYEGKLFTSQSFITGRIMQLIESEIGDALGHRSTENENN